MGCWVLTDKYKEDLVEINCCVWDDQQSENTLSAHIDLQYDSMMNKLLKNLALVVFGQFKNLDTLYRLNKFVEPLQHNGLRVVIMNFYISDLTIDRSLEFKATYFIGDFTIHSCVFKESVFFISCTANNVVKIDSNCFFDKLHLDIETGSNRTVFNNNKLAYAFYLSYRDNIVINNIEFIDEYKNSIGINKYFKNSIKTHPYFNELRETYAFIKNHFHQKNNYITSNSFYLLEMLARAKELKISNKYLQRFVFFMNRITSNHGQSILLPILWVIALTVLCALVQWCTNKDGFYWLGVIFFPYFPDIDYKELNRGWMNQILLFGYLFVKSISAMLWWQFIRAIRKDIKR